MTLAIWLDDQPGKPPDGTAGQECVAGDGQSAEAVLLAIEIRVFAMLIRPLDRGIVDIVPGDRDLHMWLRQHQSGITQARIRTVALKPVIAADDMAAAMGDHEMRKAHEPAVTDLHVIRIDIDGDALAFLCKNIKLVRDELTAIHHQILTAPADRGDAAILGAGDVAVADRIGLAVARQHDRTGDALAIDVEIHEIEAGKLLQTREVKHVTETFEAVPPRSRTTI